MASDPVAAEIDEEQKRDWRDESTETAVQLLLAEKAAAIARVERLRKTEEALAKFARDKAGVSDLPNDEGDMVSVGNKVTNYYQGAAPQTSNLAANGLKKLAVVLSLLGGGGALGFLANQYINPTAPAAVDTDTDTLLTIDFPE